MAVGHLDHGHCSPNASDVDVLNLSDDGLVARLVLAGKAKPLLENLRLPSEMPLQTPAVAKYLAKEGSEVPEIDLQRFRLVVIKRPHRPKASQTSVKCVAVREPCHVQTGYPHIVL